MSDPSDPRGGHAAELEREYNARAAIPGHVAILADWRQRSAAFRAGNAARLDLRCAGAGRPAVDYFPAADGAPLLVYLHGGYWQRGDRKDYSFLAAPFPDSDRGVAFKIVSLLILPSCLPSKRPLGAFRGRPGGVGLRDS